MRETCRDARRLHCTPGQSQMDGKVSAEKCKMCLEIMESGAFARPKSAVGGEVASGT